MSNVIEKVDADALDATHAVAAGASRLPLAAGVIEARGISPVLRRAVIPYLSRQVQGVGRAGVAGAALLVFAGAFFVGANSPLKTEIADLRTTLDASRQVRANPSAEPVSTAQGDMQSFVKHLPPRAELPSLTGKIVAQAAAAGISLERGTYDFTVTHSGNIVRARMSFPVHGRYPDIRHFIDGTLAENPGVAVDGLRFERKDVSAAEIDADIRFAVYLRAAP
jgi:hypothetical protein